ncbi:MAG TPA: hypothetical protein VHS29_11525 [Candidatus Acidoferrales bacterium]|jgi:hypothetical protein|nr:hypothetical protein [Candidatus Acidoferrales bacterium]
MIREKIPMKHFFAIAMLVCMAAAAANAAAPSGAGFSLRGLVLRAFPSFAARGSAAELKSSPTPVNTPSVFAPDKGKFRITISGQQVGSEDFEISPSGDTWLERSTMTAHAPGSPDIKSAGQLRLSSDGSPVRYDWSAEAVKKATGSVDFANSTAKCSADLGNPSPLRKDFKFTSPVIAVLDNNLYYQFGILARIYDWKTGGKQTFPVLIPQDMVPGTISVESLGQQQAGNGKYETLRVSSTDLEIMLFVDGTHRMMRLEVPSSNVVIERE